MRVEPATARPGTGRGGRLSGLSARQRGPPVTRSTSWSLLRAESLRVKPRFAEGGEQVVGYSVAFKGRRAVVQRHPPRARPEAHSDPCRG